jgi:ice-binding like protein
MTPVRRCAIGAVMVALALVDAGCGSKSPDRATPTGPRPPAAADDQGRVTAFAVAPSLGAAGSFAVVGASTVTNTGPTVLTGDLGISPGLACTGFPAPCIGGGPGTLTGTIHAGDATALNAQNAIGTAYVALASQPCNVDLTGTDLGGLTLTPGTYCFATSAQLTGTLTLNGLGNPGAVWVFQIGSTLTTASGSRVAFINGGQSCGAFWQVGSSATLGTSTAFSGNILALASDTLNTGASNSGAVFARTGAVTLDTNQVAVVGSCGSGIQPPPTPIPGVPTMPKGAGFVLLVVLLGGGVYSLSRR